MVKYACLNPIAKIGLGNFTDEYVKVDDMKEADAILVRSAKIYEEDLSDNLLAIARAGAGVNNIPIEDCAKRGIVVFNTPGANANGVKELVIAGMLLASRDIIGGVEWIKTQLANPDISKAVEKQKKQFAGSEISGKKLGVIGLGAIGRLVANAATHLGMEVYGYDPYITIDGAWDLSRSIKHIKDVEEIYAKCDYITVHVPLLDNTKEMINAEAIDKMKSNVVLLNFARDLLVDEKALVEALKAGKIRKYVTDFANTTVTGAPNVIITPHIGASTQESEDNCAVMAVEEIMNFIENGNIINSVNYPRCDMGICNVAGRIAVYHSNTVNMISAFTGVFGKAGINISDLTNKSKGEHAYTLIDVESPVTDEVLDELKALNGVVKVRKVK